MKRRTILAIHRWLGSIAAIFLLSVSLTGLALNHSEFLGLDETSIHSSFILDQYGMSASSDITAIALAGGVTISYLNGRVFRNDEALATGGPIVGISENELFTALVLSDAVLLLTPTGELIEEFSGGDLPFEGIDSVGKSPDGTTILVTDGQAWQTDEEWLDFSEYSGDYTVTGFQTVALTDDDANAILTSYQGNGVPLYRVILDLHSGRLFGLPGRTLMDLSAVAVIILIVTGLTGWARKSGKRKETAKA
ncbi:MAG: PepSY-associated TM helix domain-containing protein [Verrucomicrobiota bacterium]